MAWDYSLVYVSESTPGLAGFLYQGDNLRVFINLLFNVGYLTSWDLGICLDSDPPAVSRGLRSPWFRSATARDQQVQWTRSVHVGTIWDFCCMLYNMIPRRLVCAS